MKFSGKRRRSSGKANKSRPTKIGLQLEEPDEESTPIEDCTVYRAEDLHQLKHDECFEINIPGATWTEICDCNHVRRRKVTDNCNPIVKKPNKIKPSHYGDTNASSESASNEGMDLFLQNPHQVLGSMGLFDRLDGVKNKRCSFPNNTHPQPSQKPLLPRVAWSEPTRKTIFSSSRSRNFAPISKRWSEGGIYKNVEDRNLYNKTDNSTQIYKYETLKTPVIPIHFLAKSGWESLSDEDF